MRLDRPIDPVRSRGPSSPAGEGPESPSTLADSSEFPIPAQPGAHTQQGQVGGKKGQKPGPALKQKRPKTNAESEMESYWDAYHASGGIRYRLSNTIQCFQNPDDRDAAVQLLKGQCAVNDADAFK